MQVYIDTKQTRLAVRNNSFFIKNSTTNRIISPHRITSIAITSNALINASAIKLAANYQIPIYYYNRIGGLIAQLTSPNFLKQAKLRRQQINFMTSDKGLQWAINQLCLKTDLQLLNLTRFGKKKVSIHNDLEPVIKSIKTKKNTLKGLDLTLLNIKNTIMGIEGGIARDYYKAINIILPKAYQFVKRTRQPGQDYYNTAINYLYGMTYAHITKSVQAAGLDTFVGALHTTPLKESLVFDAIEPFRPIIDKLLVQLFCETFFNKQHFKVVKNGYWLSKKGKQILIPKYTDYLQTRIKIEHRVTSISNHMYWNSQNLKNQIQQADVPNIL